MTPGPVTPGPPARDAVRAGVDLGGTGSRVVVCDGPLILGEQVLASAQLGAGSIAERVERLATIVRDCTPPERRLAGVGIGASGPIAPDWSEITNADTLPWFSGFALPALLADALGVPVQLDNDAVTAALGEYHFGAGRGSRRLLVVTIGTGIGAALLVDGVPFRTVTGQHPDAGHLPVFGDGFLCYCGLTGCFEQHASRLALERRLGEAGAVLPANGIGDLPRSDAVSAALDAYGFDLGRGLESLHVVWGPDRIVLGGGTSRFVERFEPAMRAGMSRAPGYRGVADVTVSDIGDLAGAIGASTLTSTTLT